MKYIKICAIFIVLAIIVIIPACFQRTGQAAAEPVMLAEKPEGGSILAEILERAQVYENLYDDDGESENLKNTVREARRLSLSVSPDESEIMRVYSDFNNAETIFKSRWLAADGSKPRNPNIIHNLYINNIKCAFDSDTYTFYYTMGKKPGAELKFIFDIENLNGEKVFAEISDGNNSLGWKFAPELNKEYKLAAHTSVRTFEYKIIFIMLPVIQINDIEIIADDYGNAVISVTDPDFEYISFGGEPVPSAYYIESNAGIKRRGAMARGLPKNSYAIKFWENGQNKSVRLFNLRSNSDWILDAMFIDGSRMRNRISTDVWNDMSSPLYYMREGQEHTNGTRGVFAEVFLNDEYLGLYCFTEKIDRAQLQLDRNEDELRSIVYKGRHWGDVLLFRSYQDYNNNSSWWNVFEQKYPNPRFGGQIEWSPLADFIRFFVESDDAVFAAGAADYIDIQNFVEYTIFMILSYAYDNTGKNLYWSVYDITDENLNKIFVTPWDLDGTWGKSWHGGRLYGHEDGPWMDSEWEHDTELFRRLVLTNAGGFADKMRETWARLKEDALSLQKILGRFEEYFDLLEKSGAWDRESDKWRLGTIDSEREFAQTWVTARWNYTDNLIRNRLHEVWRYAPDPPAPRRRR